MNRLQRVSLLAELMDRLIEQGSCCSETLAQKMSFLFQELLGVPLGFDFILYRHGPFSFELTDELTAMRADEQLVFRERAFPFAPDLVPADASKDLRKRFSNVVARYARELEFVSEHLAVKDGTEIESLAMALFVQNELPFGDADDHVRRLCEIDRYLAASQAAVILSALTKIKYERKTLQTEVA